MAGPQRTVGDAMDIVFVMRAAAGGIRSSCPVSFHALIDQIIHLEN